ncbi:MAG: hypothetical protein IT425_08220 [Pirellulales bacterium]|nr:hypothetical protein [Pirellulales bacterium]
MVNFPGRDRRRRVLKDEVLSATSNRAASAETREADDDAPRYSDAAAVENHPQITDFIPRRYRTIATLVLFGVGTTGSLAALDYLAVPIATAVGLRSTAVFDLSATGSIVTWLSAVVLALASAVCLLTYSIRRHRIDDFRGRYRVWRNAALVCLLLSANSVVGFHQVLADALSHLTGLSALREGAIWWIALAGIPMTWVALRTVVDVLECRLAAGMLLAAETCYTLSAATFLGLFRAADPRIDSIITGTSLLLGHWLALAASIAYARHVILDAQGLIPIRRRTVAAKTRVEPRAEKIADTPSSSATKAAPSASSTLTTMKSFIQANKSTEDTDRWVDGRTQSDRYDHDDDEESESSEGDRKLSKADRKRLRKLKTQGRAA